MTRATNRRQLRLETMLDAAMEIASTEGMGALTITRLCERVHLSVGGLYRYFPSKEAIHVALQARTIANYGRYCQQVLAEAETALTASERQRPETTLVRLLVAGLAYLDFAIDDPLSYRLVDGFLSTPDQLLSDSEAKTINGNLQPILDAYAQLFEEARRAGMLTAGDAMQRTHVVWASVHGLGHFRKRDRLNPPPLQLKELAKSTLMALLHGWGADEQQLAVAWDTVERVRPRR